MSETVRTPPVSPTAVDHHVGRSQEFLDRCTTVIGAAEMNGEDGLAEITPHLFDWITDERNLCAAWDYLAAFGGQSPGPNGWRYRDFTSREKWSLLRCLRDALRAKLYRPGPVRRKRVPRLSGWGFRTVWLQNIEDRVVARAITHIIQPIMDPGFDTHSFGFRPGLSRIHALAAAEAYTTNDRLLCWVVDDGKDAFDKVPRNRLLDVLRLSLPDNVTRLIELVMTTESRRGIRQGSRLSPLLLNVYLDHFLDQPWRRRHPDEPLIRSADDILICCGGVGHARRAYSDRDQMMITAGMPLKGNIDTAIVELARGQTTDWLGYRLGLDKDDLTCQISDRAWRALGVRLEHAHTKPCSPLVADAIVKGWISQLGPCFRHEDASEVLARVRRMAAELAFDEISQPTELLGLWRKAFDRWTAIRAASRSTNECRTVISSRDAPHF